MEMMIYILLNDILPQNFVINLNVATYPTIVNNDSVSFNEKLF